MLTLLITANVEQNNLAEKHLEKIKAISKVEKKLEIVFLARANYKQVQEIKYLTVNVQNHYAIIASPDTTDDEMVQIGLEFASGNDVLLCTVDTLPSVLVSVLEKRETDRKIVWVRKKGNPVKYFFRKIGISAYNLGLAMIGKNNDNFSEVRVQYFNGRIVENLAGSVKNNRELRITNSFKQITTGIAEPKQIYENDTKKDWKERAMLSLGIVSFIYIIALLALAVIYPCFHNMTYSWWMVVLLIAWVLFGVIGIISTSKRIYKTRCGTPLRVDDDGNPNYGSFEFYQFGDPLPKPVDERIFTTGLIKSKTKIKQCFKNEVTKKEETKKVKKRKPAIKTKNNKK